MDRCDRDLFWFVIPAKQSSRLSVNAAKFLHPKCAVHFFPFFLEARGILIPGFAGVHPEKACFRDGFADCFAASLILLIAAAGSTAP